VALRHYHHVDAKQVTSMLHWITVYYTAINEWQNDCGPASRTKDNIQILVNFDTAKHSTVPRETLFV